QGHQVRLFNRSAETIRVVQSAGGIRYSGVIGDGFAPLGVITTDLSEAVAGADLILVCLPATAFEGLALRLAPLLDGRQPVVLNPGGTGGALAFRRYLTLAGCRALPPIAETNTLTYICRKRNDEEVYISSVVRNVRFAALPASAGACLIEQARALYP